MRLRRQTSPSRLISLVSMVDVLLIMLVFFMVTSSYLNLDMIPMAKSADEGAVAADGAVPSPVLIRLGHDGAPYLQGRRVSYADLATMLSGRPKETPVMILPSLRADTQSLVSLMDVVTSAGMTHLRVMQLAAP